jgi:iron complex transport system substrate-binding protein
MLYAVGAGPQIAATDLTSNHPAEALETPKLDSFNFNVEEVAALDPDLVVIAFDFQDEAEQLASLDIPFLLLSAPATLEGMFDQLAAIGEATGHAAAAAALSAELSAELEDLEARSGPLAGVTFFHEIDETLFTTTSASFLGDLYARLGLANIADGAGGENQFPQLSPEYILEQDPRLVFLGDAGFGVTVESVAARPGWAALSAVVNGDVIPLDGDVSGRWGPRTITLMAQILEAALEAVS